ncbi:MAG: cell division protein ZapA [Alistipes sp.]|nr:cell division protein ZapA [Alistipes sp.]
MAKDELSIRLKIAGKSYPMKIAPEKEEVYRQAESEINDYFARIRQRKYKYFEDRDYLALAALKFAIDKVDMARSREVLDEDMRALERIDAALADYLDGEALK